MLGTNGGIRAPDGTPIALGYHRPLGDRRADAGGRP